MQFEYKAVAFSSEATTETDTFVLKQVNAVEVFTRDSVELGRDGWELVSVIPDFQRVIGFFKRVKKS